MKTFVGRSTTRLIMPVALAAALVALVPSRAWAPTAVEYAIAGMWHGFFLSDVNGDSGPFTINNTSMRNRRFGGTLDVGDLMIPYQGTLAEPFRFTVVGRGADGMFVVNQGTLMVNGDGVTAFAHSNYRLTTADGTTDTGTLIFLQDFKAKNPPQLSRVRDWTGPVMAGGTQIGMVNVMLSPPANQEEMPSFFMGEATVTLFTGDATQSRMTFPFEVTISDRNADGESLVHALGRNAGVMFKVDGMFMGGENVFEWCINATFSAEYADGSMLNGSFGLTPVETNPDVN